MIKPIPEYINYGWEKVHLACESGDIDWLKELFSSGIDIDIKNDQGNTPIISAIIEKEIEIIDYLIKLNVQIDGKTLIKAVYSDNQEIIKKIINCGVDINYVSSNGWSILIHFIINGDYPLLIWFLDKYHPDINNSDKEGLTAIFHSSGLGYIEMTQKLIDLGIDLNHQTISGLSLIDWCDEMIENPNVEKAKRLIINATHSV